MLASAPPHILCIDDNPARVREVESAFHAYGCEVVVASTGVEGMTQFQAEARTLLAVLVNHVALGTTGPAFVQYLRGLGYEGYVIVISRSLTLSEVRAYRDGRVAGFFFRPLEIGMATTLLMASIFPSRQATMDESGKTGRSGRKNEET